MPKTGPPMLLGSRPSPTLESEVGALAKKVPIMPIIDSRRRSWHQTPGNPYNTPADNMMFHIVGDPYQVMTPVHERPLPEYGALHYDLRHFAGMTHDGEKILNVGGLPNGRMIMQAAGYAVHTLDITQDEAPVAWHTREVQASYYGGNVSLLAARHLLSIVEPDEGEGLKLKFPAGEYLDVNYSAMSTSNGTISSGIEAEPDVYSQVTLRRVYSALRYLEYAYGWEALYSVSPPAEQIAS